MCGRALALHTLIGWTPNYSLFRARIPFLYGHRRMEPKPKIFLFISSSLGSLYS